METTFRTEADLREHQRFMLDFLIEKRRVMWAAQPGTGKTAPALTAIARFLGRNPNGRVLVCSFRGVVRNVPEREALKWGHTRALKFWRLWQKDGQDACLRGEPGVYLCNWERMNFIVENASRMKPFGFVWFDESSALKHRDSRRAKQAMAIAAHAAIVLTTDGAPRSGGLSELWTQLQITRPKSLGSFAEFEAKYCDKDETGKLRDKPGAAEQLAQDIKDIAIVFRAEDVTDVPEIMTSVRHVTLPEVIIQQIDQLEASLAALVGPDGDLVETKSAMGIVTKIEQLMAGRALSGTPEDAERHIIRVHDEKLDALMRLVNELNGEPLLVASKFRAMTQAVIDMIPGAVAANSDTIGSLLPAWQRGEIPVLVANTKSLGHGVDGLQDGGARHVCFLTQVWSGAERQQFIARLKRSGQKSSVIVHDILACFAETDAEDDQDPRRRRSMDQIIQARVTGRIGSEESMLRFMAQQTRQQLNALTKEKNSGAHSLQRPR